MKTQKEALKDMIRTITIPDICKALSVGKLQSYMHYIKKETPKKACFNCSDDQKTHDNALCKILFSQRICELNNIPSTLLKRYVNG
eukprot:TRINITY_DN31822_c0_g1_i1.p2 TRINITY_DN31822_c0_g1~~TRINITY_DN31822_c0_g1_i1.p2  ORF type:complete len:101 (-),score=3.04 TRINITY_DN31822_c0_g1_i1:10-267(-)